MNKSKVKLSFFLVQRVKGILSVSVYLSLSLETRNEHIWHVDEKRYVINLLKSIIIKKHTFFIDHLH